MLKPHYRLQSGECGNNYNSSRGRNLSEQGLENLPVELIRLCNVANNHA
jgi:hypothetical protein